MSAPTALASPIPEPLHRFTVEEYHSMIDAGFFVDSPKVELLDGLVVEKMVQNPPHSSTLTKLLYLLTELTPKDHFVRSQLPITLRTSEPEPDLAVIKGPMNRYETRHPGPSDVAIVIEVSDESLLKDRRDKGKLYAEEQIQEYWIVNLIDSVVEVYTQPAVGKKPKHRSLVEYSRSQSVPYFVGGQKIADISFEDILP
jgi:Uma2 family endonuclease